VFATGICRPACAAAPLRTLSVAYTISIVFTMLLMTLSPVPFSAARCWNFM
jgi:hypothetical protein